MDKDENVGVQMTDLTKNEADSSENESEGEEFDPWKLPEVHVEVVYWSDLSTCGKIQRVLWDYTGKIIILLCSLYLFICSLDFLSNSFRLIGGKAAGSVFRDSSLLRNPVVALMISVLFTAILQSSSTTTGIAISLVISNMLDVSDVIPIVMGANIGTSITSTFVSFGQVTKKNDFRRAFAAATVHDIFNWVAVLVLLPLEVATGYLYHLTKAIMSTMDFDNRPESKRKLQFLKTITKPFTSLIIQVDKNVLNEIAQGKEEALEKSIIKHCCNSKTVKIQQWNLTSLDNSTYWKDQKQCVEKCTFLFEEISNSWSDATVGGILFLISIGILTFCFVSIVKILYSMMRGHILVVIKKFINSNFPGKLSVLTGYVAILIGCAITMLVQSSSVITSALTPLVGVGILSMERMYPLTLGANLGTTFVAILIALSQSVEDMPLSFQVALCHVFFNVTAVVIFYPIPFLRIPIRMAKFLGNITANYRWFCAVYMAGMFILFPAAVFGLSTISWIALVAVFVPLIAMFLIIVVINVLQHKKPRWLPAPLRTWLFLPIWCRSLEPYDRYIRKLACRCCRRTTLP